MESVTENADVRRRHGEDWLITGDIMHRIFERHLKGAPSGTGHPAKAEKLFGSKGMSSERP